jgi:hypothetical protein
MVSLPEQLADARRLLGISQYADKPAIKNAIYEAYHWNRSITHSPTRQAHYESARDLLLTNYKLDSSPEAKAARRAAKEDGETRGKLQTAHNELEQALKLIPNVERDAVIQRLWNIYQSGLSPSYKTTAAQILLPAFVLTTAERAALDRQRADWHAKWEATKAREAEVKAALEASWREQDPVKKKALRKIYLDLTHDERKKKSDEARARKKALDDGIATLPSKKTDNPDMWAAAIHEAGHVVTALILRLYLDSNGAEVRSDGSGAAYVFNYQKTDKYNVLHTINSLAGALAQTKSGTSSPARVYQGATTDREQQKDMLSGFCKKNGLDYDKTIKELTKYARALVKVYWPSILKVAERILATSKAPGRHLRVIHDDVVRTLNLQQPKHSFVGVLADVFDGLNEVTQVAA